MGGIKSDNNHKTPHNEPSSTIISGICYKPLDWKVEVENSCNIYTDDLSSKNISYIIGDENNFYWVWNSVDDIITEIYTKKGAGYIANTIENNEIKKPGINKNFTWVFYRGDCFESKNGLRIKPDCRELPWQGRSSDPVADTCIIPESRKTTTCPNKDMNTQKILKSFRYNVGTARIPSIEYKTFVNLNVYLYEKDWKLYFKNQNWTNWVIFYPNENENKNNWQIYL